MRILDRYLLREFILYSLLGIATFVALFIVVDLFEKLDIFVDHRTPIAHGGPFLRLRPALPSSPRCFPWPYSSARCWA